MRLCRQWHPRCRIEQFCRRLRLRVPAVVKKSLIVSLSSRAVSKILLLTLGLVEYPQQVIYQTAFSFQLARLKQSTMKINYHLTCRAIQVNLRCRSNHQEGQISTILTFWVKMNHRSLSSSKIRIKWLSQWCRITRRIIKWWRQRVSQFRAIMECTIQLIL